MERCEVKLKGLLLGKGEKSKRKISSRCPI